jgi:hypothetical protein
MLTERIHKADLHSGGLQYSDGFAQIEFALAHQVGPGLDARDEDFKRVSLPECVRGGRIHGAPRAAACPMFTSLMVVLLAEARPCVEEGNR